MKSARFLTLAILASIAMLLYSAAFAMGPEHTGSWFNQNESGHGFSIEYGDAGNGTPMVVVYWYVYDKDGAPVFLTGTGYPDSTGVDITFYAHYGMEFGAFDPTTHQERDGGIARFTFQDDKNGTFEYFPSTWTTQNFGHSQHQMSITKLFGVTHPNDEPPPPPTGEPVPVPGSWSGRMIYDRSSPGTCHDADVSISVSTYNSALYNTDALIVFRDSGGLDNVGGIGFIQIETGSVTGYFEMFDLSFSERTNFTLLFDTQGSAEGYWNYENGACYGTWSFTKVYVPPPTGEPVPVPGSWSGRMIYDRSSPGTCHDADVSISVSTYNSALYNTDALIVFRDSGGLDNVGGIGFIQIETGSVTGYFEMFDLSFSERTNFTLLFDTQGSAEGYWNYENGACYGSWSFQKE